MVIGVCQHGCTVLGNSDVIALNCVVLALDHDGGFNRSNDDIAVRRRSGADHIVV